MQRKSVLLPPPLGPMTTRTSPRSTFRVTSRNTRLVSKRFSMPST